MLTASFTIAHIITYLALVRPPATPTPHPLTSSRQTTGIHLIFNYGVVKLYTNSVMSSLNSRREWVNSLSHSGGSHKQGGDMSAFVGTTRSVRPQVTINVETHEMVDIGAKGDPEWPDMHSGSQASDTKTGGAYAV